TTTKKPFRRQPAEDNLGVRYSGRSATTVGGRAWVCARALRPHPKGATRVDPGERTAARPDGVDIYGRQPQRQAADRRLGREGHQPGTETDVRRGAAHVEGD